MSNCIYVIMTMTKLESDEHGWPNFGSSRVVGYYNTKDDAIQCVTGNYGDIWETVYNFAVVERIDEGLYGVSHERFFFKYNIEKGEYEPFEEPLFMEHYVGLTMG